MTVELLGYFIRRFSLYWRVSVEMEERKFCFLVIYHALSAILLTHVVIHLGVTDSCSGFAYASFSFGR